MTLKTQAFAEQTKNTAKTTKMIPHALGRRRGEFLEHLQRHEHKKGLTTSSKNKHENTLTCHGPSNFANKPEGLTRPLAVPFWLKLLEAMAASSSTREKMPQVVVLFSKERNATLQVPEQLLAAGLDAEGVRFLEVPSTGTEAEAFIQQQLELHGDKLYLQGWKDAWRRERHKGFFRELEKTMPELVKRVFRDVRDGGNVLPGVRSQWCDDEHVCKLFGALGIDLAKMTKPVIAVTPTTSRLQLDQRLLDQRASSAIHNTYKADLNYRATVHLNFAFLPVCAAGDCPNKQILINGRYEPIEAATDTTPMHWRAWISEVAKLAPLTKEPRELARSYLLKPTIAGSYGDGIDWDSPEVQRRLTDNGYSPAKYSSRRDNVSRLFVHQDAVPCNHEDGWAFVVKKPCGFYGDYPGELSPMARFEPTLCDRVVQVRTEQNWEYIQSFTFSGNSYYNRAVRIPESDKCLDCLRGFEPSLSHRDECVVEPGVKRVPLMTHGEAFTTSQVKDYVDHWEPSKAKGSRAEPTLDVEGMAKPLIITSHEHCGCWRADHLDVDVLVIADSTAPTHVSAVEKARHDTLMALKGHFVAYYLFENCPVQPKRSDHPNFLGEPPLEVVERALVQCREFIQTKCPQVVVFAGQLVDYFRFGFSNLNFCAEGVENKEPPMLLTLGNLLELSVFEATRVVRFPTVFSQEIIVRCSLFSRHHAVIREIIEQHWRLRAFVQPGLTYCMDHIPQAVMNRRRLMFESTCRPLDHEFFSPIDLPLDQCRIGINESEMQLDKHDAAWIGMHNFVDPVLISEYQDHNRYIKYTMSFNALLALTVPSFSVLSRLQTSLLEELRRAHSRHPYFGKVVDTIPHCNLEVYPFGHFVGDTYNVGAWVHGHGKFLEKEGRRLDKEDRAQEREQQLWLKRTRKRLDAESLSLRSKRPRREESEAGDGSDAGPAGDDELGSDNISSGDGELESDDRSDF